MSNQFVKDRAIEVGLFDGYEYWIVPTPGLITIDHGLNGYIVFPKRPVKEKGYDGILTYVPVHGGITYAHEDELGMVYGFDTLHHNSEKYPRTDKAWIKKQIAAMLVGITKAASVEKNYLRCKTNEGKLKYAQMVWDTNSADKDLNFGTMINLIFGEM